MLEASEYKNGNKLQPYKLLLERYSIFGVTANLYYAIAKEVC